MGKADAPLRLGLLGATGRMGTRIRSQLAQDEFRNQIELVATPGRGDDLSALLNCDAVIDFSLPDSSEVLASQAVAHPRADGVSTVFIVGTTGFSSEKPHPWESVSKKSLVLVSANFSPGVQVLLDALASVSSLYEGLGFSAEMTDIHHVHKKDSPSGTALLLAHTLCPPPRPSMTIVSRREGEVIGTHEIRFKGAGENLVFRHEAESRDIFARGAILASLRLVSAQRLKLLTPGKIYSLREVLKAGSLCR